MAEWSGLRSGGGDKLALAATFTHFLAWSLGLTGFSLAAPEAQPDWPFARDGWMGWDQQTGGRQAEGGEEKEGRSAGGETTLARKRSSYAPCDWSEGPCSITPDSIATKIAHAAQAVRGHPMLFVDWVPIIVGAGGRGGGRRPLEQPRLAEVQGQWGRQQPAGGAGSIGRGRRWARIAPSKTWADRGMGRWCSAGVFGIVCVSADGAVSYYQNSAVL
ncbi:hypothetical protein ACJ73_06721 [Blastomyces percursus]|uniref:Uncharacterized protein n=1 Tax=Blastomyces percursus TaxID=1658174 RepID=A0A1J9Q035_9EURO|nr:hypothetical protein ACJ73_06721 [Blastomyces percursus]